METEMEMEMEWKWNWNGNRNGNRNGMEMEMQTHSQCRTVLLLAVLAPLKLQSPLNSVIVLYKARQRRVIGSHQRPLPLRPAASTVKIVFRTMTRTLLMAVAP